MNQLSTNFYQEVAQAFSKLEEELRTMLVNSSYYDFAGYKWPSMAAYQNKRNGHTRFTMEEVTAIVKATPELGERMLIVNNYDKLRRRLADDLLATQIQLKLLFAKTPKQPAIINTWKGPAVISYNQFIFRVLDYTLWTPDEISAVVIRLEEFGKALSTLYNPANHLITEPDPSLQESNRARYKKGNNKKKSTSSR
ncbi:hypothetical protein [Spirosoma endophyticum]|uniref:Uncharacterized protein n=1 Tax=Spirosoma endophyticum TaxID=662367 RepID=A0A1I2BJ36_9BACT|nr:hypothetical protein [Spirosoma endophyticum]SFE56205.1 hypothetical protein SAMN05216167_115119 [Spirosoma endophyticum]